MWQLAFFEKHKSPSTERKHCELEKAFTAWLARSPDASDRVVFDGFSGAGRFAGDDSLGSPLLLLRWAQRSHQGGRLRFVFVEKSQANFERLQDALGALLGQPEAAVYTTAAFVVEVRRGTFEECAAELLSVPTCCSFSFVDPYGCEGVRFATVAALAKRGDVVWHLPVKALYTQLISPSGGGARQVRRMDALLGGYVSWTTLRDEAATSDTARMRQRLVDVVMGGLAREGISARLASLRGGASQLVCMTRDD